MLLAIDIDNRTTDFGVFDQEKLVDKFSITTDRNRSVVEIKLMIKLILMDKNIELSDIHEIIISNVVPELSSSYDMISRELIGKKPIFISAGVKTGLNIKCESPREVGSDRIIKAVAATKKYTGNIIIVSASSITTVDYINAKKEFLGGLILPGINLLQLTVVPVSARVQNVELKNHDANVGKNSERAFQDGS